MEVSMKTMVLLSSILFTGITAGLCFTWSNAITPGIGRLDDLAFLKSFQEVNRVIINPSFIMIFFSPALLLFVNAYWARNDNSTMFYLILTAAIIFFFGVGCITVFRNVPLNELLDKTQLEAISQLELSQLRAAFEESWNRWHLVRTITSITSFLLLLVGVIFLK